MNEQTVFQAAIDGDLPYVVICVVNSEFALARRDMCLNIMLFFDRYYLREARFSERSTSSGMQALSQKRQKIKRSEV